MVSYEEACEVVGYDRSAIGPEKKIVYLAYKDGECKEFMNLKEATKFSKLFEKKCVNQEEIDNFTKDQIKKERLAGETFIHELREDYPELSNSQFSCIWEEAWEDSHSYGYDEVASNFEDIYSFIKRYARCD